jgi:hypothetical protein
VESGLSTAFACSTRPAGEFARMDGIEAHCEVWVVVATNDDETDLLPHPRELWLRSRSAWYPVGTVRLL